MQIPIYLDYMATTPVDPRVKDAMLACLTLDGNFGNAASKTHSYGWRAEEAISNARQQLADLIHANARSILWVSGATEANNLAIKGAAHFYSRKGRHIITCKTEHKAVLDVCKFLESNGYEVSYLDVDKKGFINIDQLSRNLRSDTVLVSLMQVNNEIGVIQDIKKIAHLVHEKGALLHVDGAQSVGKIEVDVNELEIDYLSISAHKMYGPKGIGALYIRQQPRARLEPLIHGGGHEQGLRAGTLPTHQIVGFGEAARIAKREMQEDIKRIQQLRDKLWEGIKQLPQVKLNGDSIKRIAHNLNVSFAGVEGESLLMGLRDIAVSSGSACTSASIEPSHVLRALGVEDELAHSSIRFSLGKFTTDAEIDYAIQHIVSVVHRLRAMSPLWKI